jgi:hypothetical protein
VLETIILQGAIDGSSAVREDDVRGRELATLACWSIVHGLAMLEPLAQQRLYRLRAQSVKQLHKWMDRYRCIWEERFEQLDELVEEIKRKEKSDAAGR